MKKTHPSPRYILLPAIILLILGAAAIPFYLLPRTPRAMEEDLSRISSGDYNAAFLSTYPIETYQEEKTIRDETIFSIISYGRQKNWVAYVDLPIDVEISGAKAASV